MARLQFLLVFLLTGLIVGPVRAQLSQTLRLEMPVSTTESQSFDVTPLADQGVLLTVQEGGTWLDNSPPRFTFRKYDTQLRPVWYRSILEERTMRPVTAFTSGQYRYQLFRAIDSNRFRIIRVSTDEGMMDAFEGALVDDMSIQQFKVLGSQAYLGGYFRGRPIVLSFSFFDRSVRVLPGLYANNVEISSIEVDEYNQEVNVLIHSTKRHCQFTVRTYGYDNKLIRSLNFDGTQNSLISGKILPVNENESLLVGNYSADCTPYSQGIYVTRIRRDSSGVVDGEAAIRDIQYIDFSQLANFFNYLKPKQQERMLARANRKKEIGKSYKFRYKLLVHDLLPTPNGLTMVAEVYYPHYRSSTLANGSIRSMDRYDGYQYTHAFVCGFDQAGKLLWDNCLPINGVLSRELSEKVQVSQLGDKTILAYPNGGQINTEVIQGNRVLQKPEAVRLLTTDGENDRVTFSENDELMPWYDRHFLAWGFQKIASRLNYGMQREVFYINKLSYELDRQLPVLRTAATRKSDEPKR